MRGHEEASGTKYYPEGLQDEWAKKDPIDNYTDFLKDLNILTDTKIEKIKASIKDEIQSELEVAYSEPNVTVSTEFEMNDIYAPYSQVKIDVESSKTSEKRFVDAISDGLRQSMERHDNLVIMGQDVAEYGGVF